MCHVQKGFWHARGIGRARENHAHEFQPKLLVSVLQQIFLPFLEFSTSRVDSQR